MKNNENSCQKKCFDIKTKFKTITGGGPPPESINKLDRTLQSLMTMDFIKDTNEFDCDNDGSTKKV